MAIYLVGDVQGCYSELKALLKRVNFDRDCDILYLAGDLVARGPSSLETLRFVKALGDSAKVVLGNHDLHLLAVYAGIKKAKAADKLDKLLTSPDADELINWLAAQPLIQKIPDKKKSAYMSHAGISPQWLLKDALEQAQLIHQKLISTERNQWLALMYGEKPNSWQASLTEEERFRYSVNALTRMRYCFMDGSLEFHHKNTPEETPEHLVPWFTLSKTIDKTPWVFGHWASLMGHSSHRNIYPLDTGCVWGSHLTLLRWGDKKVFIEQAHQ
ncbi:symmetrical bis(5'-nucleosyl)-tetraphosphatase [Colwellia sp. D2M02]|uniref:symmetrical bis(5'-nucleosyl)-tetraphosphatase n=1 Tax=Colwellia sp. D2M02 TaxID=2841562 RepID=UPI001C08B8FF|nr:symmetrical bis(5'-nucleosyl)-tetraphosphatase [Colwellia sp. D2M02]MBU2894155.1 symmetrical bis(5'-nucleosyl)-tetraphosphatase [Colwellia sp. D2M02]